MEKYKFEIFTHRCFWGKIHLFDFIMKDDRNEEWAKGVIKKTYRKEYFDPDNAKGELQFINIPKPNTFPKFSNEKPFKVKWNKGYIHNPKIKAIRWGADGWEYCLENIGHVYDYQNESALANI